MYGHNLVAVYASLAEAERVRARLITEGIPSSDIHLSSGAMGTMTSATPVREEQHQSFFEWLFGSDVPEDDRSYYDTHLREGRAALSVRVADDSRRDRILDIMEEFGPIDINEGATGTFSTTAQTDRVEEGEQVIPVVKEQLAVGKRETERRYRVRTYVIERPVEEQVTLRDERVTIERRPVTGRTAAVGATTLPQERDMEVIERHQEAVVGKRAEAVEEVVVRKEVTERPETVRGTVRETKVDIDKDADATERRADWEVNRVGKPAGAPRPTSGPTSVPTTPGSTAPLSPTANPANRKP